MKIIRSLPLAVVGSLLIAAPVFAQSSTTPSTTTTPHKKAHPAATKQAAQDGNSPTTVGPASKAYKQPTQADLPEVGPASGAYNGNSLRSKY